MLGAMLGMTALGGVLSGISGIASSALQQEYTKENMAAQQAYNTAEAEKQREWSANQAELANAFSASEAEKNRQWQENMSNTAIQRQMADLKAAGLNPALAATGGAAVGGGSSASASMPSAGTASSSALSAPNVQLGLDSAITSALKLQNYVDLQKKQNARATNVRANDNRWSEAYERGFATAKRMYK